MHSKVIRKYQQIYSTDIKQLQSESTISSGLILKKAFFLEEIFLIHNRSHTV